MVKLFLVLLIAFLCTVSAKPKPLVAYSAPLVAAPTIYAGSPYAAYTAPVAAAYSAPLTAAYAAPFTYAAPYTAAYTAIF